MHLSTGGSSSPGSMRDIDFRPVRSFEGLPDAGAEEQRASHRLRRRTSEDRHPKHQAFCKKVRPRTCPACGMCSATSSRCGRPFLWHFDSSRTSMMDAGTLGTAKKAERPWLFLDNPGAAQTVEDHDLALCRHRARHAGARSLGRTARHSSRRCASCQGAAPHAAGRRFPARLWWDRGWPSVVVRGF
jgi:hypothetical protein